MIDKLPIISAKSDAVKASNPLSAQSEDDATASFETVLAKQVAKEETEDANANQLTKDNQEIDVIETIEDPTLSVDPLGIDTTPEAGFVDAAALARKAASDSLEAATDGKVVLENTLENTLDATQSIIALPNTATSVRQASTQPVTGIENNVESVDHQRHLKALDSQKTHTGANQDQTLEVTDKQGLKVQQLDASVYQAKQELAAQALAPNSQPEAVTGVGQPIAQLSSLQQSQAMAQVPGSSNMIQAYPGKTGWNEAISQKIVWMVGAAEQSATLTLNPKDLGPLQVVIQVNNEKADATFISENPEVRKALEEGMSQLRQSMSQTGVELGQANVNSNKQHQAFQQANHGSFGQQVSAEDGQSLGELPVAPQQVRVSNGLVDTFA